MCFIDKIAKFFSFGGKKAHKSAVVKKSEIIESYKNKMREILNNNSLDNHEKLQQKIFLLKEINKELSMNLFFEKDEIKELLNELSNMN